MSLHKGDELLVINLKTSESEHFMKMSLADALSKLQEAMHTQQASEATSYAEQIIKQAPSCLKAYSALYKIHTVMQQFTVLEQAALQSIEHNGDQPESYHALSNAYRFQRQSTLALQAMDKAVQLAPNNAEWRYLLGIMYKEIGQFDVAEKHFNQCIEQSSNYAQAYWQLSDITAKMPKSYIAQLTNLVNAEQASDTKSTIYAAYTLFKHFESIGEFSTAFSYLQRGASLQRANFDYNHQNELTEHNDITQVFNKAFFNPSNASSKINEVIDNSPIFICGLPRSGTTLAEQIISSHSDVAAGDELFELAQATQQVLQQVKPKQNFPFLVNELTHQHWRNIGESYLKLTQHIHTKKYFTDKMPLNYKAIGLIHKALPRAKVVYCHRPPMDLLLGAYKQILDQGNCYTYDLDELTSMIIAHHHLMQHWLKVLPGKIFTLKYQDIVTNQHQTTERLLKFLDLDWQDGCIDFHLNTRVIHTVSNAQVRQPIFTNALNAWHRYKLQLQPYANKMKDAGLAI